MKSIHLIKFLYGTNIHQDIPASQIEYFADFFSTYFNTKYNIDDSFKDKYKSIPISEKKLANNPNILAKKMCAYLISPYQVIDSEKKIKKTDDLIIVDIKANKRTTAILYLANEIEAILKLDYSDTPRFVIIVDNIIADIENLEIISQYIDSGKVLLIDRKKRVKFKQDPIQVCKEFSFDTFTKSSLEKSKFKLIKKIGHYGRFAGESTKDLIACNQFFYDGKDCVADIRDVLFDKIINIKEIDHFNVSKIVYHCPESPWLSDALLLLDSDLNILKKDYELDYKEFKNIGELNEVSPGSENILFMVDLIHTGDVFKDNYKILRKKFPNSEIRSLSVLLSDNGKFLKINEKSVEVRYSEDEIITVDFLLKVNQNRYAVLAKCPMCNDLKMSIIDDSSFINDDVLSSFETWIMCDEAGYIEEDFPTDRSEPYPNIIEVKPNSLKLITENSAYLALKYMKQIENNKTLESSDLILVLPDETTNKREKAKRGGSMPISIEETPSGYFAETLMQLKEIEYFGISREIIDKIKIDENQQADLSFIEIDYAEFYAKLRLLSDDIIIMDEFGFSGDTLKKIILILLFVRKKPKAYFPIFNFNPSFINTIKMKDFLVEHKIDIFKTLSLYNFNLKYS